MMTTETRPTIQHKPWCNHHLSAPDPAQPGDLGACAWERRLGDTLFVNVEEGENGSTVPHVAVWGHGDPMTPEEARTMAGDLVEAAALATGHLQLTATVDRNLTALIAARGSLNVNDVETIANLLGVAVDELCREDYDPNA